MSTTGLYLGNVQVTNFPGSQGITGAVNISDSYGHPTVSSSGKFQVQDVDAESSLASIVSGLSGTLTVTVTNAIVVETDSNSLAVTVGNFPTSQPVSIDNVSANSSCLNVGLYDSTGAPFTQTHTVGALDVNIASVSSGGVPILDSYGDLVGSVSECLKTALFDGSANAISSTGGSLNVQTQSGLALDSSVQTLINQNLNNGGTMWNATVVSDGDVSTPIDLSTKQVVTASFFGNIVCDPLDTPIITIYYSAIGTTGTFYQSQNTMQGLATGGGDFSLDCVSNAHYIQAKVTGLTSGGAGSGTITMYLNCASP